MYDYKFEFISSFIMYTVLTKNEEEESKINIWIYIQ